MMRLMRWLLTGDGHIHHWEVYQKGRWSSDDGESGSFFWVRCKHCGKMKYVKR